MDSHLLFSLLLVELACLTLTGYLWTGDRQVSVLSQLCITFSVLPLLVVLLVVAAGEPPKMYALNADQTLEFGLSAYVLQMAVLGAASLIGKRLPEGTIENRLPGRIVLAVASVPGVVLAAVLVAWFPF